jgi:hypothetical protein
MLSGKGRHIKIAVGHVFRLFLFSNENGCAIIGKTFGGEEDCPWTA